MYYLNEFKYIINSNKDFTFKIRIPKLAKNIKVEGQKVLLISESADKNVSLSARNVPGANVMVATDINTYAILNNKAIILTESGLDVINQF